MMRRLASIGAGLLLVTACGAEPDTVSVGPSRSVTLAPLTEDDPGWNCVTMGDHRCGSDWTIFPAPIADRHDVFHPRCMVNMRDPIGKVRVNCADGYVSSEGEFVPASPQIEAEIGHQGCVIRVGETSVIYCVDGGSESS